MYVLVLFELNKDCRFGNFTVIYIFEMVFVCLCSWFDLQAHTCNEGNYASRRMRPRDRLLPEDLSLEFPVTGTTALADLPALDGQELGLGGRHCRSLR
jgi:hypothetical protein